jgi:hypothetical protein
MALTKKQQKACDKLDAAALAVKDAIAVRVMDGETLPGPIYSPEHTASACADYLRAYLDWDRVID